MTALAIAQDARIEWLEWRRAGIGGSDAAAICGEDPFRSPLEVFFDKRGYLPLDGTSRDSEPLYWGTALEPLVISRFEEDRPDLYVVGRQTRLVDEGRAWMRSTLDGFVSDQRAVENVDVFRGWSPLGIFEGKTASRRSWAWAEGVPTHVQIQVQHNLAVSQLDQAWVAVLLMSPSLRFEIHEIERDQASIDALIEIEAKFWQQVLEDVPPAASAEDVDLLREAYADVAAADQSVDLPAQARELVAGLKDAKAAVKVAEQQVDWHQAQLMHLLRDRQAGLIDGEIAVTWKSHLRNQVDIDGLKAAHPKLVAEFTRGQSVRQLRLVGAHSKEQGEA